jgi:hypothetical protein
MKVIVNILIVFSFFFLGLLMRTGCNPNKKQLPQKPDTVKITDTLRVPFDTSFGKKVFIKKTIHDTIPPQYLADTSYPKLKAQYDTLLKQFFAKNIQEDTLPIGTIGAISIQDTVQYNKIQKRNYKVSYEVQTITNTVTITKPAPLTNAFFVGGGIIGNKKELQLLQGGFLYKTKKDKMLGTILSLNPSGQLSYGVQFYYKLK